MARNAKGAEMIKTSTLQGQASVSERVKAVGAALLLGAGLIFTVGFAHSSSMHNAAHDSRHALSFPCH
jgi:cobalt transporter subunit CbtB